jgi:COP9 signalosome complex subunit 4
MENLTGLIDRAVESKDFDALSAVFSPHPPAAAEAATATTTWHSVGQGEKRSLAAYLIRKVVAALPRLASADGFDKLEPALVAALGHLPASGVEGAADSRLRQALFDRRLDAGEYAEAARILGGTRTDPDDPSSPYHMPPEDRADLHVKIAECFLEDDEIAEADAAVSKAGIVVAQIPHLAPSGDGAEGSSGGTGNSKHRGLLLRYKSAHARVLDANRKFLAAAQRYYELSEPRPDVDPDESIQMLGRAATCAILAPSGAQRQRVLGQICRDDRLRQLDSLPQFAAHAAIVTKMYRHQIIRPGELVGFERSLAEHQKATMGDGLTIMERGVVEHNMVAVSILYRTIYVSDLSRILGVPPAKAEKIAAVMIMDGSLRGSVDQVEGLLEFYPAESPYEAWDRSIASFCVELNKVTDAVKAASSSGAGE